MKYILQKTILSFFGSGYLKPASATWGSAASGLVLYFVWPQLTLPLKLTITLITFTIGWILCKSYITQNSKLKNQKSHDPSWIVLDETVGMMITTLFLTPIWWHWVLAFLLFRLFDIAKLWPASYCDKQKKGFAIMFDDVLMAIPSLIIIEIIIRLI